MVVWSALNTSKFVLYPRRIPWKSSTTKLVNNCSAVQRRMSGGHGPRLMPITPSRWQWHKFKDLFHYYTMVGLIPVGLVIFYCNVFIGPAQLAEIPEDYVPKHWEYQRHPITRFFARYVYPSPQQDYEKLMHYLFEESEKQQTRLITTQFKNKLKERDDYQTYHYKKPIVKHARVAKEAAEYRESIRGDF